MSEKLIGGVFNDPEPTPTLTELAAPVLLMAEAFADHQLRLGVDITENVAALVAFKRALKKAEVPEPTAHDALIAEARRLAEILPLENMSAWGHKVTLIADALTAERAAREDLYGEAREPKNLHRYTAVELFLKAKYCDALAMINKVVEERDAERAARVAAERERDEADTEDQKALLDTLQSDNTALRTQLTEAREELSRLGPVEEEYNAAEKMGWKPVTQDGWTQSWLRDVKPHRRLIRRVLPAEEADRV